MVDIQTTFDPILPGVISGKSYVVNYSEDAWYASEHHNEFCKETWRKKATDAGCTVVALRLHPDELFPSRDNELPYLAWSETIKQDDGDGFTLEMRVTVTVDTDKKFIEPTMRVRISKALTDQPAGTRYTIVNRDGAMIDAGKL